MKKERGKAIVLIHKVSTDFGLKSSSEQIFITLEEITVFSIINELLVYNNY